MRHRQMAYQQERMADFRNASKHSESRKRFPFTIERKFCNRYITISEAQLEAIPPPVSAPEPMQL